MSRIEQLSQRRASLVRRCEIERDAVAALTARVVAPLAWIDRGRVALRRLVAAPGVAPGVAALGAIALIAVRPPQLLRWGAYALDTALLLLRLRRSVAREQGPSQT